MPLTRARTFAALAATGVAALAAAPPAAVAAPTVRQLIVFRSAKVLETAAVKARSTHVRIGHRRCAVGAATPLAALVLSKPPKLRMRDYGSCGKRARDAGAIYVRSIGGEAAGGIHGWVYKVGNRLATAGAGDPTGPFGSGRLKAGARVTWFYCHMNAANHSCQPTLGLTPQASDPGTLRVHVTAFDDRGHGAAAGGATVHAGNATATTDANGDAVLAAPAGRYLAYADRAGSIRSFAEAVDVK